MQMGAQSMKNKIDYGVTVDFLYSVSPRHIDECILLSLEDDNEI